MQTFFMFGKYSKHAFKEMSEERTEKTINLIKDLNGDVRSVYALLGEHDLVFIVDFPGVEEVMKASLILNIMTGISFTSTPAVDVKRFDELVSAVKK